MKIKYLGTAAAEGWPGIFCHCPACEQARRLGGKNIRRRPQALINDDMMVDINCDNYSTSLDYGIDLSKIAYWPITHSHMDHFVLWDFAMRGAAFAHNLTVPVLNLYANRSVCDNFQYLSGKYFEKEVLEHLQCNYAEPFVPFTAGDYRITPLLARHMDHEQCYIYMIQQGEKSILYAHDTGIFPQETFRYLDSLRGSLVLDLVSLDCTSGPNKEVDSHMGFAENRLIKRRLQEMGLTDPHTKYVISHFSHNCGLLHEELEAAVRGDGFIVAYDGMEMEV